MFGQPFAPVSARNVRRRAFTLIELLVVIAIIAILASIAMPNYLEAQTRAKVSRALADMATLGTCLEAYYCDFRAYPRGRGVGEGIENNITPLSRRLTPLTTPIAYITAIPRDVFPATRGSDGLRQIDIDAYDYYDAASDRDEDGCYPDSTRGGMWRLASAGPDLYSSFGIVPPTPSPSPAPTTRDRDKYPGVDYDPTNGTLSWGDIVRVGPPRS